MPPPDPVQAPGATPSSRQQNTVEDLIEVLALVLRTHGRGLSEYELLKLLQSPAWGLLDPTDFRDPIKLYRVHFLLFHALYRLRQKLAREGNETLRLSPLSIEIVPIEIVPVETGPAHKRPNAYPGVLDSLARFYLDLDNLELSGDEIESMLENFWRGRAQLHPEELTAACQTLDLDYPPDLDQANRQFRRLAMLHHPDRGGDTAHLQQVNQAIALIRRHAQTN